jgi:galactose mutarotase-like enzyme
MHGFFRGSKTELEEQTDSSLTFLLIDSPETLAKYPFRFEARVTYRLSGDTLTVSLAVTNTDSRTMYYGYGAHPGFRVPLTDGEVFSDYRIEFAEGAHPAQVVISPTGHPTGESVPYPLTDGAIALSHEFFDGAGLFLSDMGDTVALRSRSGARGVRLTYTGMTHLGFWKPDHTDAPFVCIEPWTNLPDLAGATPQEMYDKSGVYTVGAGEEITLIREITYAND